MSNLLSTKSHVPDSQTEGQGQGVWGWQSPAESLLEDKTLKTGSGGRHNSWDSFCYQTNSDNSHFVNTRHHYTIAVHGGQFIQNVDDQDDHNPGCPRAVCCVPVTKIFWPCPCPQQSSAPISWFMPIPTHSHTAHPHLNPLSIPFPPISAQVRSHLHKSC